MKFAKSTAEVFVPDGVRADAALHRTTHMAVGAHQDDVEIMGLHGILQCFGRRDHWFTCVTCTDGAGSPRSGVYADYTDQEMKQVRHEEQRTAASIGRYSAVIQLDHSSKEVKSIPASELESDLLQIFKAAKPRFLYLHNPADKHPTHVACMMAAMNAVRRLPAERMPERIYGTEVWRDLDWMPDHKKVILDVSGRDSLSNALISVFDSQIAGGKRYDVASAGRRAANACYLESHAVDTCQAAVFALDLTPLARNIKLDVSDYVDGIIREFRDSVVNQLKSMVKR